MSVLWPLSHLPAPKVGFEETSLEMAEAFIVQNLRFSYIHAQ